MGSVRDSTLLVLAALLSKREPSMTRTGKRNARKGALEGEKVTGEGCGKWLPVVAMKESLPCILPLWNKRMKASVRACG